MNTTDAWTLVLNGWDPADEGRREALCTLGNGRFATRGAVPESAADDVHYPGTYAAGCYNRLRDEVGGRVVGNPWVSTSGTARCRAVSAAVAARTRIS
jgi:trehalose 6-phosphate phosphatase